MKKEQVKLRFNSAINYENVAYIQKECAASLTSSLLQALPSFKPKSILDLGTGTGYVPEMLLPLFPTASYTLNDISPDMLERACKKLESRGLFRFQIGDMETDNFDYHNLIISNFALQWVASLEDTIEKFYFKSDVFAFSCLLDGTFKEWSNILASYDLIPLQKKYPSYDELTAFILNLKVDSYDFLLKDFNIRFPNSYYFIKYLKDLGASTSEYQKLVPITVIKDIIVKYSRDFSTAYRVFFGIIKRR